MVERIFLLFQFICFIRRSLGAGGLLTAHCLLLTACNETAATPKPRAYPRVIYPEKAYQAFDENYCNFTFQYPAYARIEQDTNFFDRRPVHPCWFDVYIPAFDSRLHVSYYPISKQNTFENLKEDAFNMVDWHNKKANYISDQRIEKPGSVSGFVFTIDGPAASPMQFYLTDSTRHFLRAALYFNTQINPDSLAPVYKFVEADVMKMLETFEWKL
jgi:gliding motility-associated lipoprotein GldD